jgi:hypothetical protein
MHTITTARSRRGPTNIDLNQTRVVRQAFRIFLLFFYFSNPLIRHVLQMFAGRKKVSSHVRLHVQRSALIAPSDNAISEMPVNVCDNRQSAPFELLWCLFVARRSAE